MRIELTNLEENQLAGCCEHCNERSGCINAGKVRGWVNDYQGLHRGSPSRNAVDVDTIRDVCFEFWTGHRLC
jgi:hypothetical protein